MDQNPIVEEPAEEPIRERWILPVCRKNVRRSGTVSFRRSRTRGDLLLCRKARHEALDASTVTQLLGLRISYWRLQ